MGGAEQGAHMLVLLRRRDHQLSRQGGRQMEAAQSSEGHSHLPESARGQHRELPYPRYPKHAAVDVGARSRSRQEECLRRVQVRAHRQQQHTCQPHPQRGQRWPDTSSLRREGRARVLEEGRNQAGTHGRMPGSYVVT